MQGEGALTSEETCLQVKGHGYWSPSEKKFKFRLKVKGIKKNNAGETWLSSQRQVTDTSARESWQLTMSGSTSATCCDTRLPSIVTEYGNFPYFFSWLEQSINAWEKSIPTTFLKAQKSTFPQHNQRVGNHPELRNIWQMRIILITITSHQGTGCSWMFVLPNITGPASRIILQHFQPKKANA